jgi:ribosomal protein L5
MQVPRLQKIVLNIGLGEARERLKLTQPFAFFLETAVRCSKLVSASTAVGGRAA